MQCNQIINLSSSIKHWQTVVDWGFCECLIFWFHCCVVRSRVYYGRKLQLKSWQLTIINIGWTSSFNWNFKVRLKVEKWNFNFKNSSLEPLQRNNNIHPPQRNVILSEKWLVIIIIYSLQFSINSNFWVLPTFWLCSPAPLSECVVQVQCLIIIS